MGEELNLVVRVVGDLNFFDINFIIKGMEEGIKSGSLLKTEKLTYGLILCKKDGVWTKVADTDVYYECFYLVVLNKRKRVGFLEVNCYKESGNFEIHYIYVVDKFRNKKIASVLIKMALIQISAIAKLKNLKNPNVYSRILTKTKNLPSENLFKSLSFKKDDDNVNPNYDLYILKLINAVSQI